MDEDIKEINKKLPIFKKIKEHVKPEDFKDEINKNYCKLSMGMSHDYLLAAKYGADFVRVGSNIFGARDYSQKMNKNVEDK